MLRVVPQGHPDPPEIDPTDYENELLHLDDFPRQNFKNPYFNYDGLENLSITVVSTETLDVSVTPTGEVPGAYSSKVTPNVVPAGTTTVELDILADDIPVDKMDPGFYHAATATITATPTGSGPPHDIAIFDVIFYAGYYVMVDNDNLDFVLKTSTALTVSSGTGGAATVPGEGSFSYDVGDVVPVVANADLGYSFVNWTGTAVSAGTVANAASASTTVTMLGDYTLIANFNETPPIQVESLPVLGGDITGTSVILRGRITDDARDSSCWYSFMYFKSTESVAQSVSTKEQAVTTVNGQALFSQLIEGLEPNCTYQYQALAYNSTGSDVGRYMQFTTPDTPLVVLTVSSSVGGQVQTPGPGVHTYDSMTSVSIAAQADPNYMFTRWTGTSVTAGKVANATSASTTVTMAGDYTLVANFKLVEHTLSVSSSAGGSVSMPGQGNFTYIHGKSVSISAVALPNYRFVNWTGSAVDANQVADANAAETIVTMDASYTLQAVFEVPYDRYVDANAVDNPVQDGTKENPFGSIQQAIDAAKDEETVVVLPGLYVGILNFKGKAIQVKSLGSIDKTIIHGNYEGPVVVFESGEDANSVLSGFTITGGRALSGGAIQCNGSSPTISHCVITGNRATRFSGGAVDSYQSALTLINCTIADNYSQSSIGAAVSCEDSNDVFINCVLWGNLPDQIAVVSGNDPLVLYSDVQGSIWPGTGNISEEPFFASPGIWVDADNANIPVDASASDAHWLLGDYHLKSMAGRFDISSQSWMIDANLSPCIDLGDPNSLFDLESDPNGGRINAGAYGGTLEASRSEQESMILYEWLLDTDPVWSTQGSWQYGVPLGGGGANGHPDPSSGYTGMAVYGVNLSGDYESAIGGPYALTVGPLDCTGYDHIALSFWRWLNSDAQPYIRNTVEYSIDGVVWSAAWENARVNPIMDDQWTPITLDLSPDVDDQSTVYLRWTYELKDRAYQYSGWNIDDIEIRGMPIE